MLYDFPVLYRDGAGQPLQQVTVRAETEEEARELVEKDGVIVHSVCRGLPVIDWTKPTFNTQESMVYMDCGPTHLSDLRGKGKLPKCKNGIPIYQRTWLDALIAEKMGVQPDNKKAA